MPCPAEEHTRGHQTCRFPVCAQERSHGRGSVQAERASAPTTPSRAICESWRPLLKAQLAGNRGSSAVQSADTSNAAAAAARPSASAPRRSRRAAAALPAPALKRAWGPGGNGNASRVVSVAARGRPRHALLERGAVDPAGRGEMCGAAGAPHHFRVLVLRRGGGGRGRSRDGRLEVRVGPRLEACDQLRGAAALGEEHLRRVLAEGRLAGRGGRAQRRGEARGRKNEGSRGLGSSSHLKRLEGLKQRLGVRGLPPVGGAAGEAHGVERGVRQAVGRCRREEKISDELRFSPGDERGAPHRPQTKAEYYRPRDRPCAGRGTCVASWRYRTGARKGGWCLGGRHTCSLHRALFPRLRSQLGCEIPQGSCKLLPPVRFALRELQCSLYLPDRAEDPKLLAPACPCK